MNGNQPIARPPPSDRLAVSMPPGLSRRESAEKVSSNAFWMMMDSPKVTRIGGRIPRPSRRLRINAWSAYPSAAMSGTTSNRTRNGLTPRASTATTASNAARMLRSPWARLTIRITPKMRERPVAKSA